MQRIVVWFFILAGMGFAVALPPFQVPDEYMHWTAAVQRSTALLQSGADRQCNALFRMMNFGTYGIEMQPERKVPLGAIERLRSRSDVTCRFGQRQMNYGSVFTYFNVILARLLITNGAGDNILAQHTYYASRLLGGLLFALVLLRLIGRERFTLRGWEPGLITGLGVVIAPIFIQQSYAITSDLIVNLAALYWLYAFIHRDKLKVYDYALLTATGLVAVQTKTNFLPLFFFLAVWNIEVVHVLCSGRWRLKAREWAGVVIGLAFFAIAIHTLLNFTGFSTASDLPNPQINPLLQKAFIQDHMAQVFTSLNTAFTDFLTADTLLSNLGWLDTGIDAMSKRFLFSALNLLLYLDLFFSVAKCLVARSDAEREGKPFSSFGLHLAGRGWASYLYPALSCAGLVAAVFVSGWLTTYALYLTWTRVGAAIVDGLQPRYFNIHLIFLVYAAFKLGEGYLTMLIDASGLSRLSGLGRLHRAMPYVHGLGAAALSILLFRYGVALWTDVLARYW